MGCDCLKTKVMFHKREQQGQAYTACMLSTFREDLPIRFRLGYTLYPMAAA